MSGHEGAFQIETAECAVTVAAWRQGAGWFEWFDRSLGETGRTLDLDGALAPGRRLVSEVARQFVLCADLLEQAVRAAATIGFDLGDDDVPLDLLGAFRALSWSTSDPRGLPVVDLPDPDHDGWSQAHLGDVPLWGPDGPRPTDVHQGLLGDCSLLAVLSSVAAADPGRIQRAITDHGDGTYTVTIDGEAVRVDDEFPVLVDGVPTIARGGHAGEPDVLWPLLFEKAAAIAHGGDYDDVSSKDPEWAHDLFGGTDEMSISQWAFPDPSPTDVLHKLQDVLADGRAVTATSGDAFGHGGKHAWSVVATGIAAGGTPTVTVRNPWGFTGFTRRGGEIVNPTGEAITDADPSEVVLDEQAGTVTIPLDVFVEQFDELDYVTDWD